MVLLTGRSNLFNGARHVYSFSFQFGNSLLCWGGNIHFGVSGTFGWLAPVPVELLPPDRNSLFARWIGTPIRIGCVNHLGRERSAPFTGDGLAEPAFIPGLDSL